MKRIPEVKSEDSLYIHVEDVDYDGFSEETEYSSSIPSDSQSGGSLFTPLRAGSDTSSKREPEGMPAVPDELAPPRAPKPPGINTIEVQDAYAKSLVNYYTTHSWYCDSYMQAVMQRGALEESTRQFNLHASSLKNKILDLDVTKELSKLTQGSSPKEVELENLIHELKMKAYQLEIKKLELQLEHAEINHELTSTESVLNLDYLKAKIEDLRCDLGTLARDREMKTMQKEILDIQHRNVLDDDEKRKKIEDDFKNDRRGMMYS